MDQQLLEGIKQKKIQEAEELYRKYNIEVQKEIQFIPSWPAFSPTEEHKETKTIKLSNSTTSMVCF